MDRKFNNKNENESRFASEAVKKAFEKSIWCVHTHHHHSVLSCRKFKLINRNLHISGANGLKNIVRRRLNNSVHVTSI